MYCSNVDLHVNVCGVCIVNGSVAMVAFSVQWILCNPNSPVLRIGEFAEGLLNKCLNRYRAIYKSSSKSTALGSQPISLSFSCTNATK